MISRVNKHLLYSFSIVCLSTLFSCNGIAFKKKPQSKDISLAIAPIPSISHLVGPMLEKLSPSANATESLAITGF